MSEPTRGYIAAIVDGHPRRVPAHSDEWIREMVAAVRARPSAGSVACVPVWAAACDAILAALDADTGDQP